MRKKFTLLFALLASASCAMADVVDYVTGSTTKFEAYKIAVRRGPNGNNYSDNSSTPGFMLANADASDSKLYSTWKPGSTYFNTTYDPAAEEQHFYVLRCGHAHYIYNLKKKEFLATADRSGITLSSTATPVNIYTYGTDASYKYYITTSSGNQLNFNDHNTTGVSGSGTDKDAGSLINLAPTGTCALSNEDIETLKSAITSASANYTDAYYINELSTGETHWGTLGYPSQNAYDTYKAVINNEAANIAMVANARTAFLNSGITYPEDGKAYYIQGVNKNGNAGLVYATSDNKLGFMNAVPSNIPATAIFYCHKVGERKYIFTNNNGRYMRYRTDNSSDGFTDAYDENLSTWTLQPMQEQNGDDYDVNRDNLSADPNALGLFLMRAKRTDSNCNEDYYLMAGFTNQQFHASSATKVYYTASNQTSAFRFVEAPQQNSLTTTKVKLSEDGQAYNLATYSSPFATTLPKGMNAYAVVPSGENYILKKLELTDNVLPAKIGVIVSADAAQTYQPIPAAATPETSESNLLCATNGTAVSVDATANAYIFTKEGDVAFFGRLATETAARNIAAYKAYLNVPNTGHAARLSLNFDNGNVTGIDKIANTRPTTSQGATYDLTGRRVLHLQRGLYISNGKKIIIK